MRQAISHASRTRGSSGRSSGINRSAYVVRTFRSALKLLTKLALRTNPPSRTMPSEIGPGGVGCFGRLCPESHLRWRSDMRGRQLAALLSVSAFVFTPLAAVAQTRPTSQKATKYEPPRTPWGQPDLQGIWNNVTATPLQRPAEYKDKAFLSPQEAAEFAARAAQREADGESRPTAQQTPGQRTGYASSIWFETTHSLSDRRTSLLVDQEDGRLPAP